MKYNLKNYMIFGLSMMMTLSSVDLISMGFFNRVKPVIETVGKFAIENVAPIAHSLGIVAGCTSFYNMYVDQRKLSEKEQKQKNAEQELYEAQRQVDKLQMEQDKTKQKLYELQRKKEKSEERQKKLEALKERLLEPKTEEEQAKVLKKTTREIKELVADFIADMKKSIGQRID